MSNTLVGSVPGFEGWWTTPRGTTTNEPAGAVILRGPTRTPIGFVRALPSPGPTKRPPSSVLMSALLPAVILPDTCPSYLVAPTTRRESSRSQTHSPDML